jgi:hypothetical protein
VSAAHQAARVANDRGISRGTEGAAARDPGPVRS